MTRDTARRMHELVLKASAAVDESVAVAQTDGEDADYVEYRLGAGHVLDAIMHRLLEPIYRQHPDLIAPQLDQFRGRFS